MVVNVILPKMEHSAECEDVIDLGAPRPPRPPPRARRLHVINPNPRLYPDPQAHKGKSSAKHRAERRAHAAASKGYVEYKKRGEHRTRSAHEPARARPKRRRAGALPNPRLYTAPPPAPLRRKPPPPPLRPLAGWAPPPPQVPQETASQVALNFTERKYSFREFLSTATKGGTAVKSRGSRVVPEHASRAPPTKSRLAALEQVAAPSPAPAPFYQPRSEHFRLRSLDSPPPRPPPPAPSAAPRAALRPPAPHTSPALAEMTSTPHSSVTPDDGSDANDSMSAPNEYLAEFLSCIMSRRYAGALRYCRLILQYEPHNATARGFYPLLRHKAERARHQRRPSASDSSGRATADSDIESDGSCASLSLDSSPKSSRSASPAAPHAPHAPHRALAGTSSTSEEGARAQVSAGGCWLHDDNGNVPADQHGVSLEEEDLENDNAAGGDHSPLLKDATLRLLRAQFACSIK